MSQAVLEPVAAAAADLDSLYEVVNGRHVELTPMSVLSIRIASLLSHRLGPFAESNGLGIVVGEMLFVLDAEGDLKRRPDLAFVSADRWPIERGIPEGEAWDIVPTLAVEVNSPTDRLADVLAKIREYFEAGVDLVWLIIPSERLIQVFDSFHRIRVVTHDQELDGGAILPGFRVPVADLFPRVAAGPA